MMDMNENAESQNTIEGANAAPVLTPDATDAMRDAMAAWTPAVGDIVILKSEGPKDGVVLMAVENVFRTEKPAPEHADDATAFELITLVEAAWMGTGATLQRATFDQRVLLPLDLMLEGIAHELDGGAVDPATPKKRRGRPPGTKNKPKRGGKRKRRA